MLLAALVAFAGAAVAFVGSVALARRWAESRRTYLVAWTGAQACMTVALAATCALAFGYSSAAFRAYEVTAALFGLLWLALGIVELLARHVPVAFAARLLVVSLSIVGGVILAADPLRRPPAGAFPRADDVYLELPLTLLTGAHGLIAAVALCGLVVAAGRAWRGGEKAARVFSATSLTVLDALLLVVAVRVDLGRLTGAVAAVLSAVAAVLLWVAALQVAGLSEDEGRRGRSRHRSPSTGPLRATAPAPSVRPVRPIPRPELYGLIMIFTLREGAARPFDAMAERTVQAIKAAEPGTLVFACHTVANAPQQRIFYQVYRDRAAYEEHERQPHVRRFMTEQERYVLATNVIRLKLNAATGIPEPEPEPGTGYGGGSGYDPLAGPAREGPR